MNATLENSEAAILDRLIRPADGGWPAPAARAILGLGFEDTDKARMTSLLEKAKAGELNADESRTLENYRHVGRLLELMKSRARKSLAKEAA
jgi:hypothetical protein